MTDKKVFLQRIHENEIKFLDLRFTDTKGIINHITLDTSNLPDDLFENGLMFDGSSIQGWKPINDSDMILIPDLNSAHVDPFFNDASLVLFCNIKDPSKNDFYNKDPRSIAQKAEAYLKLSEIGDVVNIGPETEFFLFDEAEFHVSPHHMKLNLTSDELSKKPKNNSGLYNTGHKIQPKSGYAPTPPLDRGQDIRSEMLNALREMDVIVEKHHHEVAPCQHELGIKFDTLVRIADKVQIHKYAVHHVAHLYNKTATFMPKPVYQDNGSGMHVHLSIFKNGKPLFSGNEYAGLSTTCLHFIGGIIKHAKALNAFTNASTNSYKRLVPGYEAPVLLAYSSRNRSASCRIPYTVSEKAKRVEIRFPDSSSNPYLAFSALLMAGLDGIKNKINPGNPIDKDLYELSPKELAKIPTISKSLTEALDALNDDRDFLKVADVFTDEFLDSYILLKRKDIERLDMTPHPIEFDMYYSI